MNMSNQFRLPQTSKNIEGVQINWNINSPIQLFAEDLTKI